MPPASAAAEFDWLSPTIIGLVVASLLGIVAFIYIEPRAKEPMLPLRLFSSKVFSVASVVSFVVGFAMLGAMTFLPTYLQYVHGVSATSSGLRMLPMVLGLLGASITAGVVVGRTGHYKTFPIVGSLLLTLGLFLMSTMDAETGFAAISLFMLVLGVGIGLCMQVLVIIVQNTSDYRDLGVATSGVTFFRTLGSSFGAAAFGAVYSDKLEDALPAAFAQSPGLAPEDAATPALLHSHPAEVIAPVVDAYADVLQSVFLYAAPVGIVAFLLSLMLPQVPLRDAARAGAGDMGDGFAMAEGSDPDRALERVVGRLMNREGSRNLPQIRIASGTELDGAAAWCVAQVLLRERHGVPTDLDTITAAVGRVPASVLLPAFDQTARSGYLTGDPAGWNTTTIAREQWDVFATELKRWLVEQLARSRWFERGRRAAGRSAQPADQPGAGRGGHGHDARAAGRLAGRSAALAGGQPVRRSRHRVAVLGEEGLEPGRVAAVGVGQEDPDRVVHHGIGIGAQPGRNRVPGCQVGVVAALHEPQRRGHRGPPPQRVGGPGQVVQHVVGSSGDRRPDHPRSGPVDHVPGGDPIVVTEVRRAEAGVAGPLPCPEVEDAERGHPRLVGRLDEEPLELCVGQGGRLPGEVEERAHPHADDRLALGHARPDLRRLGLVRVLGEPGEHGRSGQLHAVILPGPARRPRRRRTPRVLIRLREGARPER